MYCRKYIKSKIKFLKHPSPFRRILSPKEAQSVAQAINSAFTTNVTSSDVQKVAKIFRKFEKKMIGRIAGDIDDHIFYYFMVLSSVEIGGDSAIHGEIGVLFGGSLLMLLHALNRARSSRKAVAIDPFQGYYGTSLDPVTKLPVTIENVEYNIRRFKYDRKQVLLINAASESTQALERVANFRFASLWIDGDHSYEGVKRDWENYSQLILPGGHILIDNYHDLNPPYPGIDRFIDDELLINLSDWEMVTVFGRNIVFKKVC